MAYGALKIMKTLELKRNLEKTEIWEALCYILIEEVIQGRWKEQKLKY